MTSCKATRYRLALNGGFFVPDLKPQLAPGDIIMARDQGPGKLQLKTKGPYVIEKVLSSVSFVARDL